MNERQRRAKQEEAIQLLRIEWERIRSNNAAEPPEIFDVLVEYEDVVPSRIVESFAHYNEGSDEARKQIIESAGKNLSGQFQADYGDVPSISSERKSLLQDWINAWRDLALLNAALDKNAQAAKSREKWKNRWGTYASPAVHYPDEGEGEEPEEEWWNADYVTGENRRSRRDPRNQPTARANRSYENDRDEARARMKTARQELDAE